MTFGEEVFNRRRELGLSNKDVAEALGVAPATISKIEAGSINPKSKTSKKLAEFLHINEPMEPNYLTGNKTVDLAMLERRVVNTIYELEIILDILQAMKGEN